MGGPKAKGWLVLCAEKTFSLSIPALIFNNSSAQPHPVVFISQALVSLQLYVQSLQSAFLSTNRLLVGGGKNCVRPLVLPLP